MIKLALTDLDDTLLARSFGGGHATPFAMDAIRAVLDAGLHFGPVSGRTPASMSEAFCDHAPAYATGAFSNGQLVLLDGEVIHREYVAPELLQRAAQLLDELDEGVLMIYGMEVDFDAHAITRRSDLAGYEMIPWVAEAPRQPEVTEPSLKANIFFRDADVPHYRKLHEVLKREVPELDFVFPSQDAPLVDILPAGYGKGSAVRILAEALGLELDEVAVFGDSENDLSMLEAVPNSVAVANASEQVKAACRWHIGDSLDDAVAHALAQIAAAAKTGDMPEFMRA